MLLASTTDKLSLITDQAGDIDVVVTYIDRNQSTGAVGAANRQLTAITTATTTDILAAPAATTDRKVESITIRNAHASTSNDVLVQYNANGTLYEMGAARLYPTEMLQWSEQDGFTHMRRSVRPVFESRLSPETSNTTQVVTGNSRNISFVANANVNIRDSLAGAVTRVLSSFGMSFHTAAVSTTGIAIGMVAAGIGFSSSGQPKIQAVSNNDNNCGLSSNGGATSVDQLAANGTSPATIPTLSLLGSWVKWAQAASGEQDYSVYMGIQSEVDTSLVTVGRGTMFSVFEATDY
jgi:hypothetical protein